MYNLKIQNFQSIHRGELPIKDFTVLVGKTNRGKSAILRALRTVLLNEWNSGFVKVGEKETKVEFEICEKTDYLNSILPGLEIEKVKVTKPSNEYEISLSTGETHKFPKVGKNTPEGMECLNLSGITTEREDVFNLNFQSQLEPLFLITSTEVELTSFVNKVFDISRFEKALRDMKTDDIKIARNLEENDKRGQLLSVEKENTETRKKILQDSYETLEIRIKATEQVDSYLREIKEIISVYTSLQEGLQKLEKEREILNLQKQYLSVISLWLEQGTQLKEINLSRAEIQNTEKEIKTLTENLKPLSLLQQKYTELSGICENITELNSLQKERDALQTNQQIHLFLQNLLQKEDILLAGISLLQDCKKEMREISEGGLDVKKQQKLLVDNKQKVEVFGLFKDEVLKSLKICPVCEQLIS